MYEWRNGQLMSDEELEDLFYKSGEPPLTLYEKLTVYGLIALGCLSFWAFVGWLIVLKVNR